MLLWDEGEDFDVGEVGVHGLEPLDLAGGGMDVGSHDDDAAVDSGGVIGQGGAC